MDASGPQQESFKVIPIIPDGFALRIDSDTGVPRLIKVERGQERPGISMESALAQQADDAARASAEHEEASQWLRSRSPRQAQLELYMRVRELEKRLSQ